MCSHIVPCRTANSLSGRKCEACRRRCPHQAVASLQVMSSMIDTTMLTARVVPRTQASIRSHVSRFSRTCGSAGSRMWRQQTPSWPQVAGAHSWSDIAALTLDEQVANDLVSLRIRCKKLWLDLRERFGRDGPGGFPWTYEIARNWMNLSRPSSASKPWSYYPSRFRTV